MQTYCERRRKNHVTVPLKEEKNSNIAVIGTNLRSRVWGGGPSPCIDLKNYMKINLAGAGAHNGVSNLRGRLRTLSILH